MKRYLLLGLIILSSLLLAACAIRSDCRVDLTRESWMREVESNPQRWMRGADDWFLTGNPHFPSYRGPYAPTTATMNVQVPYFSKIKVNGDFQVQIYGTDGSNSVQVYGPNDAVRATVVNVQASVQGNILCVTQVEKAPRSISHVIVRIGVNRLTELTQLGGRGRIEGMQLQTNYLTVTSLGSGNMYLSGNMNLARVNNFGRGCINIFGANTPVLDIKTNGGGATNVVGNVGIRSIVHQGQNDINIIGANSSYLRIFASGKGKIGINGVVNLREVKASDFMRVYVCKLMSTNVSVLASQQARIGLAGTTQNASIGGFDASSIWARDLCADTAYVRTQQHAHVNISACYKIFASATGNSSIYFFGSPHILTRFVRGNAIILPVGHSMMCSPVVPVPVPQMPRNLPGEG